MTGISVTGSGTEVDFTEATERTNLVSGSTLSTLFGKVKKWFSDLKAVAFTGSYKDLTDTPTDLVTATDLSTALSSKVDVVAGKGLSTNDYTTAEKTKLASLSAKEALFIDMWNSAVGAYGTYNSTTGYYELNGIGSQ